MSTKRFCIYFFLFIFLCPLIAHSEDSTKFASKDYYYKIGKGDVLEINVWKEKDLTRVVKVRTDGRISLPLLDDIKAEGLTPIELKHKIEKKLSNFITTPFVTVIVNEENNKFYMVGEVSKVGEYDLTKDLTILQAIAIAGGFTEWANKDNIILLRYKNGKELRYKISYKDIISGKHPEQNYFIQRNDTIIVK
ncbi:polysaccharide biosynthesis/export family protein [Desulfothermus okinawensis]